VIRRQLGSAIAAAFAALLWVSAALAESAATLVVRDLPARGAEAARFDLVGLHWRGAGSVRFRTRSTSGRWSAWRVSDVADGTHRGWRFGEPYWVGSADRIQWRAAAGVRTVRAYFVQSVPEHVSTRSISIAGSPSIVMRTAWKANEEIVRAKPRYAPAVRFAVVHHTAGTNDYGPADSAAIVRGIELYHVQGNGWNDIGYNFLVDRYGQVFEGRSGGVTRNVVGAHAAGFNTGSVGVAVLGNYTSRPISAAARDALVRLLAWRLDLAHVDPLATITWASGGNSKYSRGTPVVLRTISGHRDTGWTDCPGNALYTQLPTIARAVAQTGLPKLYDPVVSGRLGGPITFSARLSAAQAWTVTIRDAKGAAVATGAGNGTAIRWTWNSAGATAASYMWSIEAGPTVRPATGTIANSAPPPPPPPPPPLAPILTDFSVAPPLISPDGDGNADSAIVTYRLRRSALVTARVLDASGLPVATLFQEQRQSARVQSWQWTAAAVPDGLYQLEVSARGTGARAVTVSGRVIVDRTLGFVAATPNVFSPNGDGSLDTTTFSFDLGAAATVTVAVVQNGREITRVYSGALAPGPQQFVWNGQTAGAVVPDGRYDLVVTAVDALATSTESVRFTVDSTAK
jgi:flagellar hook assembly protein FlgD